MTTYTSLGSIASKIRSKNAGPFWITIDIFFADESTYRDVADSGTLNQVLVADLYGVDEASVKVFTLPNLHAIKISYPRPVPQGSVRDRDVHAAQQYLPLVDVQVPTTVPAATTESTDESVSASPFWPKANVVLAKVGAPADVVPFQD